MSIPNIKYEIMGFKFETCQLIDIKHKDGATERVRGTREHQELLQHGDITLIGKPVPVLSITYQGQSAYVPLLLTGPISD